MVVSANLLVVAPERRALGKESTPDKNALGKRPIPSYRRVARRASAVQNIPEPYPRVRPRLNSPAELPDKHASIFPSSKKA